MEIKDSVWRNERLADTLQEGGVVIMPTDTVYGFVAKADNPIAVSRVYTIRKRATEKPCIILVGDISELDKFSIPLTQTQREAIRKYWPGPVSISLSCPDEKLTYLHRGTNSLAFRMPASEGLQSLLKLVGPVIAPSANPEGMPVAKSIDEAKAYFGDLVDLYIDGGEVVAAPSKIIKISPDGTEKVVRD
jgi:L-threonylcarbamoyladenylate synthase